ncbi:6-phosphogluconate dehydrogenase [Bacillus sp. SLBN-57]
MCNTIGVIGLGVMGSNIALNMASKGEQVAVYNYTRDLTDQLVQKTGGQTVKPYYELEDFVQSLKSREKSFLWSQQANRSILSSTRSSLCLKKGTSSWTAATPTMKIQNDDMTV